MYKVSVQLTAEFIGTLFLLAAIVGSGIMAENLAQGNNAIALLGNTLATGAMLTVLITVLRPLSGAHFNPAVTLVFSLKREINTGTSIAYVIVQIAGGILGVWLAHFMFDVDLLQSSTQIRTGVHQWLAEVVATFGLVATILGTLRTRPKAVAAMVGLYISAAYWFTASTSFANPAVTIARSLTNTFAGIEPNGVVWFVVAQLVGALLAWLTFKILDTNSQSQNL